LCTKSEGYELFSLWGTKYRENFENGVNEPAGSQNSEDPEEGQIEKRNEIEQEAH
jgi:hypothetical protein